MSIEPPAVSVIMPVFNAADTVEQAVQSVLNQTFKQFELLILDDGSTDDTVERVGKFKDARIRVVCLEHIGLAAALNMGAEMATAEWIARQDADDQSAPQRLARQMQLIADEPTLDAVGSWWAITDTAKAVLGIKRLPSADSELRYLLNRFNPFCHGSMILKKESLTAVGGYDENLRFAQDYDLWLRMANAGMKFGCVQDALYFYEITPESVARGRQKLAFSGALRQRSINGGSADTLVIGDLPPMRSHQRRSLYFYTVGSLKLDEGQSWAAANSLAASIAVNPLNWRAILKLVLTPLPNSLSRRVVNRFRQAAVRMSASRSSARE